MTGPRTGSRPHMLTLMQPGERRIVEAPPGRLQARMAQITVDIHRAGLRGKISLSHLLGVDPAARTVTDLIVITRGPDE